jgi:hypothetical protein
MKSGVLVCAVLLAFCSQPSNAVAKKTRDCTSSRHWITGTVVTADGKEHLDVEAEIPMKGVKANGTAITSPVARRRACRAASDRATSIIESKGYRRLAKLLCRSPKAKRLGVPIKVRPERARADAWHGNENNDHARTIAGEFVQCRTDSKRFNKPMFQGKPLDWCLEWAKDCGKPAAKRFCEHKGYRDVQSFSKPVRVSEVNASETSIIGTPGQVCSNKKCKTFTYITCVR